MISYVSAHNHLPFVKYQRGGGQPDIGSHFPYSIGVTVSFVYLVVGILTTSSSDTLGQVPEWQLFLSKHFIMMLLTDGIDESFFYKERKYAGKRH